MSGYVAMVRFDGAPLDGALFAAMAESIRFRGPDRHDTLAGPRTAFAHALLATTPVAKRETQPLKIDGVTFCGDVRIDARETLVRAVGAPPEATDPELVLLAYAKWGEPFVDHFIGDYSFVLWDERERKLVAVRDCFARRPLFYAWHDGALLVTNNLPTLLDVPGLADDLDEAAVADFLLFGRNLHARRTTFARIARVPAAHLLIATARDAELHRYWTIEQRPKPRRMKTGEVYEQFREVMGRAVADRTRADRVVVSLSGGLDSNVVAALLTRERKEGVTALTTVWRELFHDIEGRYAELAARAYGIPIEFHAADRCDAFEGWSDRRVRGLEPTDEPCTAPFFDFVRRAVSHGRVIATGEGGDPALYTSHDYFFRLLKRFRWLRVVREAGGYALTRRKRPPLLLRSHLLRALGRTVGAPDYPRWINPDLEQRLGLRERWLELYAPPRVRPHPYRPEAWRLIDSATWARTFEAADPGSSGQPLQWVSPYFDVRVIEFLFSIPPMPHFANKDLVRQAMRGLIPDELLRRPKTPLPTDPGAIRFRQARPQWARAVQQTAEIGAYVEERILCDAILNGSSETEYQTTQQAFAVSLSLWLQHRNR